MIDIAIPISELKLCVRSRKCLRKLDIETLGQLVAKSSDDLLAVKNFGVSSLKEVRDKLEELGLFLLNEENEEKENRVAVPMPKNIKCCGALQRGNFCSNCGRRLVIGRIKKYQDEIKRLRAGIYRYVEAHHKKMAGSTIQYSVKWLEDLLEEDPPPLD